MQPDRFLLESENYQLVSWLHAISTSILIWQKTILENWTYSSLTTCPYQSIGICYCQHDRTC
jgi:hypothetical protein